MPNSDLQSGVPPTMAFEYSRLKLDPPQVRLIRLLPGSSDEALVRKVEIDVLNSDLHGKYDALSYAWGDEKNLQTITVEGAAGFKVTITENLWLALHRIRNRQQTRRLWVDAICINQSDPTEKNEQLGKIGEIYRQCAQCIVWYAFQLNMHATQSPLHANSQQVGGIPDLNPPEL